MSPPVTSISVRTAIRPCNSYDLFSRLEREYILQILHGYRPPLAEDDRFDPRSDANYSGPPLPSRYGDLSLPGDWYRAAPAGDCRDPEGAGDVARDPMARRIAEAWSRAGDEIRIFCAAASAALALHPGAGRARKHPRDPRVERTRRTRRRKSVWFAARVSSTISELSMDSELARSHSSRRDRRRRRSTLSSCRPKPSLCLPRSGGSRTTVSTASLSSDRSSTSQSSKAYLDSLDALTLEVARRASVEELARSVQSQQEVYEDENDSYWEDSEALALEDSEALALEEARRASLRDLKCSVESQQNAYWEDSDALEYARRASVEDVERNVRTWQRGADDGRLREEDEDLAASWGDLHDVQEVVLRRSIEDLTSQVVERQERGLKRFSTGGSSFITGCREFRFQD